MLLFPVAGVSMPVSNAASQTSCPTQDTFQLTLLGDPNSFNYLTATGDSSFEVALMEYFNVYPAISPTGALDYNLSAVSGVSHNANYTQWIFNIKPDLKWSDGTQVTAKDILATYSNLYAFNPQYDVTNSAAEVVSESQINTTAAEFNLNVTDAHFPETISSLGLSQLMPASVINASSNPGFTNFGTDLSMGPWYVSNFTGGSHQMIMLRNPYFQPQPTICQIDVNFVESTTAAETGLVSGTTDLAPIDPSLAQATLKTPNLQLLDEKAATIRSIEWNDTVYPYNMTAFRQAIAYTINDSQIVAQADSGYGVPGFNDNGLIPSTVTAWYDSKQASYNYSPSTALSLLQTIGITKGSNGQLQYSNGSAVTISIWADTNKPGDAVAGQIVQSNLKSLGFNAQLQTASTNTLVGYLGSNNFNTQHSIVIISNAGATLGDPVIMALPGWDTIWTGGVSNSHWEYPPSADAQYNANYSLIQGTNDPTQEHTYSSNIQELNAKYLPSLVLDYPDYLWAYSTAHFTGWKPWPAGWAEENTNFDVYMLAGLQPATATSTASSTLATSSTPTASTTIPITTTSSSATGTSTTSTSTGPASYNTALIAGLVVIAIIVVGSVIFFVRRRGPTSPT
jgi:peptide/nickel transport system substrate-binding protein